MAKKPKKKTKKKQTTSKRTPNGKFKEGNTEGNRWKPGESGNPGGRKPGPCLKTALRKHLEKGNNLDKFIEACYEHGLTGNHAYAKEIWERIHGKETTRLDHTSGGQPIKGYVAISPDDWDEEEGKE